jgi:hypothetical protein
MRSPVGNLLLIAPEILEEILFLELPAGAQLVSERALREALCRSVDWREQRRVWEGARQGLWCPLWNPCRLHARRWQRSVPCDRSTGRWTLRSFGRRLVRGFNVHAGGA